MQVATLTPKVQRIKSIKGSLRYERRKAGYTMKQLGEAIAEDGPNVAESTIVGWESGDGSITLERAWQLAELYGISLEQLAGRPQSG